MRDTLIIAGPVTALFIICIPVFIWVAYAERRKWREWRRERIVGKR